MNVIQVLRKLSVGSRVALAALVLLLPLSVLIPASVVVLQRQEAELERSIDDGIEALVPLGTLEYDLQRALSDELIAQSGESVPDFGGLTQSVDRVFAALDGRDADDAELRADLRAARSAWHEARPAVESLVEQVRPLAIRPGDRSPATVRAELTGAIEDVEAARRHLSSAIRSRYVRTEMAQRRQLQLLVRVWGGTIAAAMVMVILVAWSIVRPVRELGRATRRLRDGESGVRVDVQGRDELSRVAAQFNDMAARLEVGRRQLESDASQDALTGLPNRRAILGALDAVTRDARLQERPFAVVMIDVDHFKEINDRFGHAAGDEALRWLATRLRDALRQDDIVGRLAGDEYLVVLPDASMEEAREITARLCAGIAEARQGDARRPGISAGFAVAPGDGQTSAALVEAADAALYEAKTSGRGRVAAASARA